LSILLRSDLEARQRNDEDYVFEDVPKEFSLPHQPSFASLLNSASKGCRFCNAIRWEFETYGFTHRVLEMEKDGLDTSVRMCIATWDKGSAAPEMQLLDRILVRAGDIDYESSEEDESEEYEDQSGLSEAESESSKATSAKNPQARRQREDQLHNPSQDLILKNLSSLDSDYIEREDQLDIHSQESIADDVSSSDSNTNEESQSLE
jgi:hypothetical protein